MNTLKRIILTCLSLCIGTVLLAQTVEVKCTLPEEENAQYHFYVQPMEGSSLNQSIELVRDTLGIHHAKVAAASDGLYRLYIVSQQMQQAVPFFLPSQKEQEILHFEKEEGFYMLTTGADNRALTACNAFLSRSSRQLWEQGKKMNSAQLLNHLKSYQVETERLIGENKCSMPVRQFLEKYAYTSAYGDYMKLDFITQKSAEEIGFSATDFLSSPEKMLDCPMANYFFQTNQIIMSTLPKGKIEDQLLYLHHHYQSEVVVKGIDDALMELFLSQFDYDRDYETGKIRLQALIEKYHLDRGYLKKFKGRRYARKGAPFPSEIQLFDSNGKEISFEKFKGYYVYVDLWASWCVPCCKEVPHLQALEKDLANPKVKFVSISTDTHLPAWQKKMKALNMEGNQFIEPSSELVEALNVSGIPHFLIYDPEGNLLYYKAPRPSTGAPLKKMLEQLH